MIDEKGGYTPLMIAASEGYAPIVRFLLEHKADANLCNDVSPRSFHLHLIDANIPHCIVSLFKPCRMVGQR